MKSIVSLTDVQKSYLSPEQGANTLALQNFTLNIRQGEFVSIVGPSGCGKSTALRMIAGLETPSSGSLLFKDQAIVGPGHERGMLFQDYALFPWKTVYKNIEFGLKIRKIDEGKRKEIVSSLIQTMGLRGFENKLPHQLSGGMKQRCALARALANEPEVLLLDEPLSAIDPQTRNILQEELLKVWGEDKPQDQRKTFVSVTHSIEEAVFLSTRVVIMSGRPGRILDIIDIDLPSNRVLSRGTAQFAVYCDTIWKYLKEEVERLSKHVS